jgi:hypothetical protein
MPNSLTDPRPRSFEDCAALLDHPRPRHVIGNHTRLEEIRLYDPTTWSTNHGYFNVPVSAYVIQYQGQTIVQFYKDGRISLHGHYWTRASLERMQRYMPRGYQVYSMFGNLAVSPLNDWRHQQLSVLRPYEEFFFFPSESGDGSYWLDDLDDELARMGEAI